MTGPRVLLIEDEPQMRRFLRASLEGTGFSLIEASTAAEGRSLAGSYNPELVLLDLGLPDGDGITLTKALREWARMPIIVISAQGREANKVQALDAGADDYLTKPFGVSELLARMRVALRHAAAAGGAPEPVRSFGDVELDLQRRVVTKAHVEVHLTPNEYRLLVVLAQHAGKVLTHGHLLKEVWGPGSAQQTHYLRVYMAQLRQKLEDDPARPKLLITEPGVGYRLKDVA
ncbi:MAG: response regulator [Myxococcaceae bacterium]|jgi:two-component system KDP operon response regulator KdpE|nr:response regulator [Myxococcaceae bacterium]MCA3015835.1 response regulator [Myxococcaceae bacterium]